VAMGAPDPRVSNTAARKRGMDIEAGKQFWSFKPVAPVAVPPTKDTGWARGDLDRFLLAKMQAAGLKPSPDATRAALARRAYFTLIGLPPTPEQIAAFERDTRPDAFDRLVDGLLASPHFGERWGRHWLDVARFAESSGGGRTLLFKDAWRYRDYVIEAFNADRPFDQFLREQIAGDLLPWNSAEERRRQITATAYLALGPTNYEEQDKQQLRFDIIDEQLDTLGKSLLGMTIGCARCHDHKFDPIPAEDYYAMAGIFASTRTLFNYTDNVARWVDTPLPLNDATEAELKANEQRIETFNKLLASAKAKLKKLNAGVAAGSNTVGKPVAAASLPGIVIDETQAKIVGEWQHSTFSHSYVGDGYLQDKNSGKGEKAVTFEPVIPRAGLYEVRLAYTPAPNRSTKTPVTILHADGENTLLINQRETPGVGGRFVSLGQFRFEKDGAGYVLVSNEGTDGHVVVDALQLLPAGEQPTAGQLAFTFHSKDDQSDEAETARLNAEIKSIEAEIKKLTAAGPQRPLAMSVLDADADAIGDTAIRVRGLVHNTGRVVPRGFLQVAMTGDRPALPQERSGRRELADWITTPDNPLTARVFVNRVWHWLFSAGIVRTTDNFGTTGELPSHPELLDHLAAKFVRDGWSVKHLIREIVLSRAWRQSVANPPATDPDNRLLSVFPRRRLDAEQLRDAMLSVSGQLDLTIGGPNIKGAGVINANTTAAQNTEYSYVFDDVRRSVYTPAFRARRLELFEAFDFANVNQPIGERTESNVPTQALYLLNSAFVQEQAALAAKRTLARKLPDNDARLEAAFRETIGRAPSQPERRAMLEFLRVGGEPPTAATGESAWAHVYQTLFACMDFRYLE